MLREGPAGLIAKCDGCGKTSIEAPETVWSPVFGLWSACSPTCRELVIAMALCCAGGGAKEWLYRTSNIIPDTEPSNG